MKNILHAIASLAPLANKEFQEFVNAEYGTFLFSKNIKLKDMPEDFLLGAFIKFFDRNAIEFTVGDTNDTRIYEEVYSSFKIYEQVISHYS